MLLSYLALQEPESHTGLQTSLDRNRPTISLAGSGGMDMSNTPMSSSMISMAGSPSMTYYESSISTPAEWNTKEDSKSSTASVFGSPPIKRLKIGTKASGSETLNVWHYAED